MKDRIRRAAYRKAWHDDIETPIAGRGVDVVGERDFAAFTQLGKFHRRAGEMPATLADGVQERGVGEPIALGFDDPPPGRHRHGEH